MLTIVTTGNQRFFTGEKMSFQSSWVLIFHRIPLGILWNIKQRVKSNVSVVFYYLFAVAVNFSSRRENNVRYESYAHAKKC